MGLSHRFVAALCALAVGNAELLAQAPAAPATPPSYRHRLLGVFDSQSGEPLEGATVTDIVEHTSALTTKTGTVTLAFLPNGGSIVRIQKLGYTSAMLMADISPADTVPITVLLVSASTTLPAMVTTDSAIPHHVSPGLQAFEERRQHGLGHYIGEAELRRNDSHTMTEVVRGIPGVNVRCRVYPKSCFATSSREAGFTGCNVTIYIDGVRATDVDLEKLQVSQFAAVESYSGPATIPPLYNMTGTPCGVILFWTRER